MSKKCKSGNLQEELLRDRLVCGIISEKLKECLLREDKVTLDKAVDICCAAEESQKHIKMMETECKVNKIEKKKPSRPTPSKHPQKQRSQNACVWCGKQHPLRLCPAFGKKNSACGKPNHFKDVCRSSHVHDLANEESDNDGYEEGEKGLFVGMIGRKTYEDRDKLFVHADVLGTSIKFKVDTGAQANVFPQKIYQRLKDVSMTKTTQKLTNYTGNRLHELGKCTIEIMGVPLNFFVTDMNEDVILDLKASQNLQLIKILTVGPKTKDKKKSKDNDIVNEYKDVFQGLGCTGIPVHIELDPKAVPVVHPPRRIPLTLKDKVKEELGRMEDMGVIVK
ncbi:Gag-Pol protein [Plakobranchus ocellatus]|uniref:Gag-Pol protein n=1 Tax=Plakobranchus ocellatus TaxID=259542 RepID=A0AAV3YMC2_9GAST|nr:Gag-Pol protein [Plakobranchus ocellatus]